MGYTHYWKQTKNFTKPEWDMLFANLMQIITRAEDEGLPLDLEIGAGELAFNGIGNDAHETFVVGRRRPKWEGGFGFCKTARKPYDTVVTACLCYLGSLDGFAISSDGDPEDWKLGFKLALKALPEKANWLSIPEFQD